MMTTTKTMNKMTVGNAPKLDYAGREALNTICTNIMFSGKHLDKILVTSCVASEGKSTMAARIAFTMAERGKSCVLVDVDMRRSVAARRFGFYTKGTMLGLAHYLTGQCEMSDIVYMTNYDNLYIVPVGRDVSNPVGLINSQDFTDLMDALAEEYDVVIVDSPPVGVVVDAVDIASACDGIVMVIEYAKRHKDELKDAVRQLQRSGTPILGCIIDKVTVKTLSEKQYYKSHYYYSNYGKEYYNRGDVQPFKALGKREKKERLKSESESKLPDIEAEK